MIPIRTDEYGKDWPEYFTQADIELRMYLDTMSREDYEPAICHFTRAAKILIPSHVYQWSYWTDRCVRAFITEEFTVNWGGGGTGKSTTYAMILLVDWMADPLGTTIKIFTTDIKKQVMRLFGEVVRMHRKAGGLPGHVIHSDNRLVYKNEYNEIEKNAGFFALGVMNTKGDVQKVSNFGIHNKRNRMVLDEMQGTPEAAFDSLVNFIQGGIDFRFIGIGNPESWDDLLGRYSRPKGDYTEWTPAKARKTGDQWDVYVNGFRLGVCLWFDGLESPRIKDPEGEKKYHFLQGAKSAEFLKKFRGENSPKFWSQVRGFIQPGFDNVHTVISHKTVQLYRVGTRLPFERRLRSVAGLDPAYTRDGDDAILMIGNVGVLPGGKYALQCPPDCIHKLQVDELADLPVSHQLANQTNAICALHGVDKHGIAADTSGNQTGPADVLRKDHGYYVDRVNYRSRASKQAWDPLEKGTPANAIYGNKISELYFLAACLMENGHIHGVPEKVVRQMTSRRVLYQGKLLYIEDKDTYKDRMKESPNEADAFVQMCWLFTRRWRFKIGQGNIVFDMESRIQQEQQTEKALQLRPSFHEDGGNYGLFGVQE